MTLTLLVAFAVAVLVVELTPGPNMAYLALVSLERGRRDAMTVVLGVTLGLLIYLLATLAGLKQIFDHAAWLYEVLRWLGVAYLLWLAWGTWRGEAAGQDAAGRRLSRSGLLMRGLIVNLLNPKAAVFYLAILPDFVNPSGPHPLLQGLGLGLAHIAVSVAVHTSIVYGVSLPIWRPDPARRALLHRWMRRIFATLLVLVAVWVALEGRRG